MISLRVKWRNGSASLDLSDTDRMSDLKNEIAKITSMQVCDMRILVGFPPELLTYSHDNVKVSTVIKSGELLIVESNDLVSQQAGASASFFSLDIRGPYIMRRLPSGNILRFVMPANNSCLFTSVSFVMGGGKNVSIDSTFLRKVIARYVKESPQLYNSAVLGQDRDDYCKWIQNTEHWGGAIELSILCDFYGVEIVVIDKNSRNVHCFGENYGFDKRVYLIYNGCHYDAMAFKTYDGDEIETIFPVADNMLFAIAKELSMEQEFTEEMLRNWICICCLCDAKMKSKEEVEKHVAITGHLNYKQ